MSPSIVPHLCLEFVHQKTGVPFDERYFTDDEYRHPLDRRINRVMADWFGRHWKSQAAGFAADPPYQVGVGAAYVIVAALFGGRMSYADNFHPDCSTQPLAELPDLAGVRAPDVRSTWPMSEYLDRHRRLVHRHGKEAVNLPGFTFIDPFDPRLQGLTMHSPLTTAYKLRGSQLYVDLVERPDEARQLLRAVRDTYYQVCDILIDLQGLRTQSIFFGACTSAWVSPAMWEQWELPAVSEIADRYGARVVLHSCGASTHLLDSFAKLPRLEELHLGDRTGLAAARRRFPATKLFIVPDSVAWARDPAARTIDSLRAMTAAAGCGPLTFQFVLEAGVPDATVEAVVAEVEGG